MTDNPLAAFVRSAVGQFEGEPEPEDDGGLGPPEATPAALAWARLSPADQARVLEGGTELSDAWFAAFGDEAEAEGEESDEEAEEAPPLAGNQLREAVHDFVVSALEGNVPDGMDPEGYLFWAARAPAAEWTAASRAAGHPEEVRPGYGDLPTELQVRWHRSNLERKMAELARTGRHLESGTSR